MINVYILDACALIAILTNEKGADIVKDLLQKAVHGETHVLMHKLNFLEVYYDIYKQYGEERALKLTYDISISPIELEDTITDDIFIMAGKLKSLYKISLADSIGLATTMINKGYFVTADHHEMDIVQEKEYSKIIFIRERLIKK
jgi:PIN domain nuclease of toxin-antitoxin system